MSDANTAKESTTCPHCGAPASTTKKRSFDCGTWFSSAGEWYQTTACRIAADALVRMQNAEAMAYHAQQCQDAAEKQRDAALEQAAKDREYANTHRQIISEHMRNFYARFLSGMRSNMDSILDAEIARLDAENNTSSNEQPKELHHVSV